MKETCPVKEKQAFICRFKGQTVKDLTLNPRQDPCRHPVDGYFRSLSVHQSQHTSFFLRLCLSLFHSSTGALLLKMESWSSWSAARDGVKVSSLSR